MTPTPPDRPLHLCPRCGLEQPPAVDCARCGVVFAKLRRPPAPLQPQPVRKTPKRGQTSLQALLARLLPPRLTLRQRVTLYGHLGALLHAGVPLEDGLSAFLEAGPSRRLARVCRALRDDVLSGKSLTSALSARPEIPVVDVALVEAGEHIGGLPAVFSALAARGERTLVLRGRLAGALAYPLMLALLSVFILGVPTYMLEGRAAYAIEVASGLGVMAAVLFFAAVVVPRVAAMQPVSRAVRRALHYVPPLSLLYRRFLWSTWAEHLRACLEAGLLLSQSVRQAGRVTSDPRTMALMERIARQIEQGAPLVATLRAERFLPASDLVVLAGGERTGTLSEGLEGIRSLHAAALHRGLALSTRIAGGVAVVLIMTFVAGRIVTTMGRLLGGGMESAMQQIEQEMGGSGDSMRSVQEMLDEAGKPFDQQLPTVGPSD